MASDLRAPAVARRFCATVIDEQLGDDPAVRALIGDAEVIASELVGNAVIAGATRLGIAVTVHLSRVRLSVFDDATGLPRTLHAGPDDPTGRGLLIVEALATAWGVDMVADGKNVWADLPVILAPDWAGRLARCFELEAVSRIG